MKYRVYVTRTTVYEGIADDRDHAMDEIDDALTEVDQTTDSMKAVPICPVCDEVLIRDTIRVVQADDQKWTEATYCWKCQVEYDADGSPKKKPEAQV